MKKLLVLLLSVVLIISVTPVAFAEQWIPVGISRDIIADRGILSGEGCQWTNTLTFAKSNPKFAMCSTDVGGVYRSYDEGLTWSACNTGLLSKGASDIEIDPMNEKHIIMQASNGAGGKSFSGLCISTDGADTWKMTLPFPSQCQTDLRDSIAFDPTSYDPATGMCMRIYWSTPNRYMAQTQCPLALYVSEDGGYTWNALPNSEIYSDADLIVTDEGELYVGSQKGFFISSDKGKTFKKTLEDWTLSVDYVSKRPDNVYVATWDKVLISTDKGRTFEILEGSEQLPIYAGKPAEGVHFSANFGFRHFNVSPVNPDHMVIAPGLGSYNWQRWMSPDGGKNWYMGEVEYLTGNTHYSTRPSHNTWSLTDENTVFSTGGDWITKATDGGLMYRPASRGLQVYMSYGLTINQHHPEYMFTYGQDYGSFGSYDGGETWTFAVASSNEAGANAYNGLIVSEDFVFMIGPRNPEHAYRAKSSSKNIEKELRIARGYRNLYGKNTGIDPETYYCYQSINDENILFAGVYRSPDRGETWVKMEGCRGVVTHNTDPNGHNELYGVNGNSVVVSYDEGLTWKEIAVLSYEADALAYNWKRNIMFATKYAGSSLEKIELKTGTITSITGPIASGDYRRDVFSVAVDPVDPDLMYIAGSSNYYNNMRSVQRSHDAGETWEVLTRQDSEKTVIHEGEEGPNEALTVTVHPVTRELWVTTSCYGINKLSNTNYGEPSGYYPEEKLSVSDKENGVYIRWYGNGKYDLSDVATESALSDLFQEHSGWHEVLYEGVFGRGIPGDNGTKITELEVDTAAWYAFAEWENPIYTYDVMKSTDGVNWTKILTTNAVEFTDTEVESGKTYYYKVVRVLDGKTTVTRTVSVK